MVKLKVFSAGGYKYDGPSLEDQVAAFTSANRITKERVVDIKLDTGDPDYDYVYVYLFYEPVPGKGLSEAVESGDWGL